MFFMTFLMLVFGMLSSSSSLMDLFVYSPSYSCLIVIRGFIFQPLFRMALIEGSYLACFCVMACSGNMLWQYVNSMNCIVCVCVRVGRVWGVWFGAPSIQRMYGLSMA